MAVVSFDCPSGPAETINDGIDGVPVNAGDQDGLAAALRRLMKDEKLRGCLGDAARRRAKDFDMTRIMPLWRRAIADALSVNRPTRHG